MWDFSFFANLNDSQRVYVVIVSYFVLAGKTLLPVISETCTSIMCTKHKLVAFSDCKFGKDECSKVKVPQLLLQDSGNSNEHTHTHTKKKKKNLCIGALFVGTFNTCLVTWCLAIKGRCAWAPS
jgi:hypothetical protein